jgi:hypothetical protein
MSAIPALTLAEVTQRAIDPALKLLPAGLDSLSARIQLLTTGLQESGFMHRRQIVNGRPMGPAKSFWQAEVGGGLVHGVRTNHTTAALAQAVYQARQVQPTDVAIWNAIENDDVLAAALARLLIFSDPYKLPAIGDAKGAQALYLRTWRPGHFRPETWAPFYMRALNFVVESAA